MPASSSTDQFKRVDYPESSCIVENTSSPSRQNYSLPCLTDGINDEEQKQPVVGSWKV
jgi:hypothetical protein